MNLRKSYVVPVRFVLVIWSIYFIGILLPFDVAVLGVYPRTIHGLTGIIFAPLIHGSLLHLISNTVPVFFLSLILYLFYDRIADKVFFQGYIYTNILVWIFGRSSFHIGASGLIYCLASFLIFLGIFRKDIRSILISLLIIFLYGGLIIGILPNQPGVSWESHLMGGVAGFILASGFGRKNKVTD
jgi:membrane associated rhomboid family serine protease